jgi:hypothetical protein
MAVAQKWVRAKRTGFWNGHRRRAGVEFLVNADAKEVWFEDVRPAVEGDAEPVAAPVTAQAQGKRGFIDVMAQLTANAGKAPEAPTPVPLSQVAVLPPGSGADLV